MRHLKRLSIALAALGALMALTAGAAVAGGWAEVTVVDGSEGPPVAGEEREIRFSLLQHGVTAVDFGEVQLTAVNAETGQTINVPATHRGGGSWSAIVTFPVEGDWQIGIAHNELETSPPTILAVDNLDGLAGLPSVLAFGAFLLAAIVVLGSMLLIGRRRPSPATATTTTVRAG